MPTFGICVGIMGYFGERTLRAKNIYFLFSNHQLLPGPAHKAVAAGHHVSIVTRAHSVALGGVVVVGMVVLVIGLVVVVVVLLLGAVVVLVMVVLLEVLVVMFNMDPFLFECSYESMYHSFVIFIKAIILSQYLMCLVFTASVSVLAF